MSIRVVCPNGHVLNVKDSFAGKTGLCPKCKARVEVPSAQADSLSEDAILNILGPQAQEATAPVSPLVAMEMGQWPEPAGERKLIPKKSCHRCYREISAELHICPFCHTYIASLSDF